MSKKAPSRNKPCPCGSGKKYKKCCELKKSGPPIILPGPGLDSSVQKAITRKPDDLKNTMRDPFEGIPEVELVRRDQMVFLASMEMAYLMLQHDRHYFDTMIKMVTALRIQIRSLEDSPEKKPTLDRIEQQLTQYAESRKKKVFARTDVITLIALRELVGPKEVKEQMATEAQEQIDEVTTAARAEIAAEAAEEGEPDVSNDETRQKDKHGNPVLLPNQNPGSDSSIETGPDGKDPKHFDGDTSPPLKITPTKDDN